MAASSETPFYVVVTAHILTSPQKDRAITLRTHLSPLDGLDTRAFDNIHNTTDDAKLIEIWPRGWPQYRWDTEDLRPLDDFVTVPTQGKGVLAIKHQVNPDLIKAAGVQKGERYRIRLNNKCLGTCWWCFGTMDDLEGVRLREWASLEAEKSLTPALRAEKEQARKAKYGDGPSTMGEDPEMLAMVPETWEVEFDVV